LTIPLPICAKLMMLSRSPFFPWNAAAHHSADSFPHPFMIVDKEHSNFSSVQHD